MNTISWSRVLGCGLLAGIVWIILGSLVTAVLGREFAALSHNRLGAPTTGFIVLNVIIDLLEGISILWLYAAIRPLYGPGPKTATIAAFAWWVIVSLGDVTWCSFGFFPPSIVIPLILGTLPALILASLAGARFYEQ
jgi:hypothetical protein